MFAPHVFPGDAPQFLVNQGDEGFQGVITSAAPFLQEAGYYIWGYQTRVAHIVRIKFAKNREQPYRFPKRSSHKPLPHHGKEENLCDCYSLYF